MTEYRGEVRVNPDGSVRLVDLLVLLRMAPSKSAAKRLIEAGAVTVKNLDGDGSALV